MKKKIFFFLLFFLSVAAYAQKNCDMCGTWIGMYKVQTQSGICDVKLFVRITKQGDKYRVRVKRTFLDNDYTDYFNQCYITDITDNTISIYTDFINQEYDPEGQTYMTVRNYYTLSYDDVAMVFGDTGGYYETWDKNKNYIGKTSMPASSNMRNIQLYREDDDW